VIDPHTLKVGDKVCTREVQPNITFRGSVFQIAAGCAVIEWTHTKTFDPLRLTSQLWRFMERDE